MKRVINLFIRAGTVLLLATSFPACWADKIVKDHLTVEYSTTPNGQWMIARSLEIQRDKPGFNEFILQPEPDPSSEMLWAEGL